MRCSPKFVVFALLISLIGILPAAWNFRSQEAEADDITLCMSTISKIEYFVQPEARKLCQCLIEQMQRHLSDKETEIFLRLLTDSSDEHADHLLREFSSEERMKLQQRMRAANAESDAKCYRLLTKKRAT